MPAAKQSGRTARPASRGRASSNGSKSRASSRSSSGRSKSSSSNRARSSQNSNQARSQSSGNGNSAQSNNSEALKNFGISALSATVGVAGGVLLGRAAMQRSRKVLGVSVPNKIDLNGVGQQIGEAGRQFGKLAGEVRAVREKAEQVGKLLS